MAFGVFLVEEAERDIEDIHGHIAAHDSVERADAVVDALEDLCASLARLPERGNIPRELRDLGITEFRELHHKPYRAIYRVIGVAVFVHCVIDGRRDMQSLLERRLLR